MERKTSRYNHDNSKYTLSRVQLCTTSLLMRKSFISPLYIPNGGQRSTDCTSNCFAKGFLKKICPTHLGLPSHCQFIFLPLFVLLQNSKIMFAGNSLTQHKEDIGVPQILALAVYCHFHAKLTEIPENASCTCSNSFFQNSNRRTIRNFRRKLTLLVN